MKLSKTIVIAITLLIEALDKKITAERTKSYKEYLSRKRTQQPLREPLSSTLPTCTCSGNRPLKAKPEEDVDTTNLTDKPLTLRINTRTGIITSSSRPSKYITSTTLKSKYTPEELQALYKINPYTNL